VREDLEKKTGTADYGEIIKPQHQHSLFADEPKCARPKFAQGQPVSEVPLNEFTCDHDYYYYYYYDTDSNGDADNPDSKHDDTGNSDNTKSDENDAEEDENENYMDEDE
jgi:hypothetical protein